MDVYNLNASLIDEKMKLSPTQQRESPVDRSESAASTETDGLKSEGIPMEEELSEVDEQVQEKTEENSEQIVEEQKEDVVSKNEEVLQFPEQQVQPIGGSRKKIGNFFGVSNFSNSAKLIKFFGVQDFTEEIYTNASTHYARIKEDRTGIVRKFADFSTKTFSAIFIAFLLYLSILAEMFIKVLPARFEPHIRRFVPRPQNEHEHNE